MSCMQTFKVVLHFLHWFLPAMSISCCGTFWMPALKRNWLFFAANNKVWSVCRRHNEHRPRIPSCLTPPVPDWKPADDEDEDERLGQGYNSMPEPQVGVKQRPVLHACKGALLSMTYRGPYSNISFTRFCAARWISMHQATFRLMDCNQVHIAL